MEKLLTTEEASSITSQINSLEAQIKALKAQLPIEIAKRLEGKYEARTGHKCDAEWNSDPEECFKSDKDLTWVIVPVDFPIITEVAYYNMQYTFYLKEGVV